MKIELETILPEQIENRSFAIIESELPKDREIDALQKPVSKRVIHTTADFDYLDNLKFSEHAVEKALAALKNGACIVTDTNMAKAGVHKASLEKLGGALYCYMADEDVAAEAKRQGCTRAAVCMEKAAKLDTPLIIAVGNAPTALVRIYELISEGKLKPELVIGVPVGFVNVVQSKELIMQAGVDYIVAAGRKGGSNVAAAICNALIYMATGER
ncbi:MAG: precorrin-8X methylmutase [Lachnospiraceae bacterium]|nr:precorrin-8X methylmutase [Lachnospiraceae bacterium]